MVYRYRFVLMLLLLVLVESLLIVLLGYFW